MIPASGAVGISLFLFAGMLACLEIGFRTGLRRMRSNPGITDEGSGVIEAAIFGLLGLLLAFSFAGGEARLDARRQLIVGEANAIGTAYLRLDLLPVADQPAMRLLFREYLDARLRLYGDLSDRENTANATAHVSQIQHELWERSVAANRLDVSQNIERLLLPALNEMMDVTTARTIALRTHLPRLILALLICVALLSGVLAGYAMVKGKRRNWLYGLIFASVISITIYAVLDLDSPRSGLIRLDGADSALQDLRTSIQPTP
jgi:hypothetical protein